MFRVVPKSWEDCRFKAGYPGRMGLGSLGSESVGGFIFHILYTSSLLTITFIKKM
jgi:hypothetical protein